ncbi:MAG: SGNH/GDSL hydrolase family protein, partial [Patescibacteria group bacterium]|nr:SGNH/GDSL hydrolase family protein [Patescibacteria group bacterium]
MSASKSILELIFTDAQMASKARYVLGFTPDGVIEPVSNALFQGSLTGSKRMLAQALVAAYDAERRISDVYGPYLLRRAGKLAAADIPSSITASSTAPASDADMTGKTVKNLCLSGLASSRGSTDVTITSPSEIASLQRWIKGFNPALRVRWGYNAYRLSNVIAYQSGKGAGQQDNDTGSILNTGLPLFNTGVFLDAEFTGDILLMSVGGGDTDFSIWVNDCLLTTADLAVGTGITASKPDGAGNNMSYGASGSGRMYLKLKWATAANRRIRITQTGSAGIGDFWFNAIYTMSPVTQTPLNWLHVGDSFSTGTGSYTNRHGLMHFLTADFGAAGINFINTAQGGTGYLANAGNSSYNFVDRWSLDIPYNVTPDVVTVWAGQNDLGLNFGPNVLTLMSNIVSKWPNALCVVFGDNPSVTSINNSAGSRDIDAENVISASVSSLASTSRLLYIPVQRDPSGPWMYGTGKVGSATGAGNTDLYSSNDGFHPS